MDGSLVIMEGSLLSGFLLLHWMVALSLWKAIIMGDSLLLRFITPMNGSLVIMGDSLLLRFVTPMDGSLVIMGDSLLLRFVLQLMVISSLWEIVRC